MTKEYLENILTEYGVAFTDSLADRLLKELEPCEDAISRVEALKVMCDKCPMYNCVTKCSSYRHIEKMAPVNPQPKTGHWILTSDDDLEYCTCSECGYQNGENWMIGSQIKFCQECGAKMQESEEV